MNKELLDQVQQALQAQQDTIKMKDWIIDQRNRENEIKEHRIAQLTASLNQLAKTQAQELQALPTLFKSLQASMRATITEYQKLEKVQKMRKDSQIKLTNELIKVANKQLELTKVLTSYQRDMPSLEGLEINTIKLESELAKSQAQTTSSESLLMNTQREIESQVHSLSKLLQQLKS